MDDGLGVRHSGVILKVKEGGLTCNADLITSSGSAKDKE